MPLMVFVLINVYWCSNTISMSDGVWICFCNNMTIVTSGVETAYHCRMNEFTPAVKWSVVVFNF